MVTDGRIRAKKTKAWTTLPNVYWLNLQVWKTYTWNRWEPSAPSTAIRAKGVVSIAYYALININEYDRELVQKHNAYWVNINELPALIFDHPEMVDKAREMMKQKASVEPIGFNLLPKLFTLSQLQSLYEAIYGEPMDKRNFRKRVAEMDFIEKTDKIDKLGSKRGAALYKFNGKAYRKDPKFKL